MTKYPTLTLILTPPFNIEFHPTHRLKKREVKIRMTSYFKASEQTMQDIEKAGMGSESGGYMASAGAIVGSFTSSGSGLAFRSLLLMDIIKFLK